MSPLLEDIEHGIVVLFQAAVGLFFMLGGAGWFVYELRQPIVHAWHLAGGAFLAVLGANATPFVGPVFMGALKATVGAFAQLASTVVQVLTRQVPPKDPPT